MAVCPNCGHELPEQSLSFHFTGARVAGPDSIKQIMGQISKGLDPRKQKPKEDGDASEQ